MLQKLITYLQKLSWPVRSKLGLAFGLVLVCFIANGLISTLLLFNIKTTQEQQNSNAVVLEKIYNYNVSFNAQTLTYSDTIFISKVKFIRDSYRSGIVNQLVSGKEQEKLGREYQDFQLKFARLYNTATDHFFKLEQLIDAGDFEEAGVRWREYSPNFAQISRLLEEERKQLEVRRAAGEKSINDTVLTSVTVLAAVSIFSIGLALFLLLLLERVVVQPLNQLQHGLKQVAQGQLDHKLEIANRDEIGRLAQSFSSAVLSLQQVFKGVQIGEDLRVMSGELAVLSQQQAAGSAQQVSALTQVTAAMQELSYTANQIAGNALRVAGLTGTTVEQIELVARIGKKSEQDTYEMITAVVTTLEGVEQISTQVNEFSRATIELNEQSETINRVVSLLRGLSEEVHLLALNASIEAASAGIYGERFKVVAQEVKLLANRAYQATEEARNLIGEMQIRSKVALTCAENGQSQVSGLVEANYGMRHNLDEMARSVKDVGESLAFLLQLAGEVSQQTAEIKQATQQQGISSHEVISSARSVASVAAEIANASRNIASNSSQLETLTNQLNRVLNQIKVAA